MTILGKLKDYKEEEELNSNYVLPSVIRKSDEGVSLKKSIVVSTLLHPATILVMWLIVTVLALLGIHLDILKKPDLTSKKDIEFVLVNNPEQPPINKNTKNRADRNTRAGGKHDPKKPQAEPSPAPGKAGSPDKPKAQPKAKKASASADLVKQIQKKQAQQAGKTVQTQKPSEPAAPKHVTHTPTPPAPIPAPQVSAPRTVDKPTSSMQIPVPKTTAPKLAGSYGGPVTAARAGNGLSSGSGTGSSSGASSRPSPSFAPSSGGSSTGTGRFSGGGQYGSGQAGNPGPGNPNGRPGIDAIKEPDFGPYMRELQRRIKMNWDPPKGNESKRVVLLFKIAKDGRLLSVRVSRSSGVPAADRAAIQAVELTAPFKPLPAEFRGQNVDIQFTFDYNVFGASRY